MSDEPICPDCGGPLGREPGPKGGRRPKRCWSCVGKRQAAHVRAWREKKAKREAAQPQVVP